MRDIPIVDRRKGASDRILFTVAFVIMMLYALSIILFYSFAVLSSFKSQSEFEYHPLSFPESLSFVNYGVAIRELKRYCGTSVLGLLFNSVWYSFGATFFYLFFHLCTSYVFTKFRFRGRKIMFFFIILYMLLPIYGSQAATYRLIYTLNIDNSPLYLITFMGGFSGSTFLILSAAWETVDGGYSEAAQIDGANHWQIFIKLMIPMVLGPVLALFIMDFIGHWNSYEPFILYLDSLPNISYGIYYFGEQIIYKSNDPAFFAAVTMVMIPILIIFAIFANKIMDKVSFGSGIKG